MQIPKLWEVMLMTVFFYNWYIYFKNLLKPLNYGLYIVTLLFCHLCKKTLTSDNIKKHVKNFTDLSVKNFTEKLSVKNFTEKTVKKFTVRKLLYNVMKC